MTEEEKVFLPAVLADSYGISQEEAFRICRASDITIDGHEVKRQNLWFWPDALQDKQIEVEAPQKRYRFTYRPPSFRG